MKKLLLVLIIVFYTGCSLIPGPRILLIPQNQYYPTFPIEEFKQAEKCEYGIWPESDNNNTYLVGYEDPVMKCIEENKQNRSNLNLLIRKVTKFNAEINLMNKLQNEKQPQEIK